MSNEDDLSHLNDEQRAELAKLEAEERAKVEAAHVAAVDERERERKERGAAARERHERREAADGRARAREAAAHARELEELAGECGLYVTPDDLEVAITVDKNTEEVWFSIDGAPARLGWRGFKPTRVAIQNAAGDVVGYLEARAL